MDKLICEKKFALFCVILLSLTSKKKHIAMRIIYTCFLASLICLLSFTGSQPITIKGKVVSNTGDPLIGVTIQEKKKQSATVTDKGGKFSLYRQIPTLQDYILIDSESIMVEKFSKNVDGSWTLHEFKNLSDSFKIKSIEVVLVLSDLYEGLKD